MKKGYILITVLVIIMVMLAISYYLADALFSETAIARNQKSATSAFHLAEGGVSEAIWRIQNNSATKNTFLNTTGGVTNFNHNPALLSGGSYTVEIRNIAKAAAVVTSTGYFQMGLKTAQRKITVNVTKANTPPPYDYDGAIFTGGATGNEDITIDGLNLTITGTIMVEQIDPITGLITMVEQPAGSLLSSRNIEFFDSSANIIKDIKANNNITIRDSTVTQGGVRQENANSVLNMPNFDSAAYRTIALGQNQVFANTAAVFANSDSPTYSGVVYVDSSLTINDGRSLTVNGLLITPDTITVGAESRSGTLTINHTEGQPAGAVALHEFVVKPKGVLTVNGILYVGDRFYAEKWDHNLAASRNIIINGGLLCRRIFSNGLENGSKRNLTIDFKKDWINEALGNPNETPVIITQHWEEEY